MGLESHESQAELVTFMRTLEKHLTRGYCFSEPTTASIQRLSLALLLKFFNFRSNFIASDLVSTITNVFKYQGAPLELYFSNPELCRRNRSVKF